MNRTHGKRNTPTYLSWRAMKARCLRHPRYVGRVVVCERWRSFENFLADMGERPAGTTLDRFPDKNGNYEPGNCRWATWEEQERNRSIARIIKGRNLAEWVVSAVVSRRTITRRLDAGWSIEDAVSTADRRSQ